MREGVAKVLDDDDYEFVNLLHSLGIQRNVAKVITYLAIAGESTSRDLERGTEMRQPEVSIAMRTLHRENWVDERDVKSSEGKGRPHKVYTLITPVDEIIRLIEEERQKEIAEAMQSIQKLKELASS
jgi:predicted transcriptional regulator